MLIVCDEGVYQIVGDIVMSEPGAFDGLFPKLGMFHFAKVLLRCAGRYLTGSGMVLLKARCLVQNSFDCFLWWSLRQVIKGMLIVSEVTDSQTLHVDCTLALY